MHALGPGSVCRLLDDLLLLWPCADILPVHAHALVLLQCGKCWVHMTIAGPGSAAPRLQGKLSMCLPLLQLTASWICMLWAMPMAKRVWQGAKGYELLLLCIA